MTRRAIWVLLAAVALGSGALAQDLDVPAPWFINGSWRVLYAPDFEGALAFTFYEGNPYQTVLDVTDLINPAAENRLQVFNTCAVVPTAGERRNHDLVLKDLTIRVKPGASPLVATASADQNVINTGTPAAGPAKYAGKLLPGGREAGPEDPCHAGRRHDDRHRRQVGPRARDLPGQDLSGSDAPARTLASAGRRGVATVVSAEGRTVARPGTNHGSPARVAPSLEALPRDQEECLCVGSLCHWGS